MGRKRKYNKHIPNHIDQSKIPTGVFWNNSGNGYWRVDEAYYELQPNGKQKRKVKAKKLAGPDATLADLYRLLEDRANPEARNLQWLCDKYFASKQFDNLKFSTQKEYRLYLKKLYEIPVKKGGGLPLIDLNIWTKYLVQRTIDKIDETRGPTAARHTYSFIRRVFSWGNNRGHVNHQPADGIDLPRLNPTQKLPSQAAYDAVLAYAKETNSVWWAIMEIEYLCRMRGIEVRGLREKHLLDDGVYVERAKGSKDTIVLWNARLRDAVQSLRTRRAEIWKARRFPEPINKSEWPLFVSEKGPKLSESGYRTSWDRFIKQAIAAGAISEDDRFSPHDLKRKGVTDTPGNAADKKDASGHRSDTMLGVYDKSITRVRAADE